MFCFVLFFSPTSVVLMQKGGWCLIRPQELTNDSRRIWRRSPVLTFCLGLFLLICLASVLLWKCFPTPFVVKKRFSSYILHVNSKMLVRSKSITEAIMHSWKLLWLSCCSGALNCSIQFAVFLPYFRPIALTILHLGNIHTCQKWSGFKTDRGLSWKFPWNVSAQAPVQILRNL